MSIPNVPDLVSTFVANGTTPEPGTGAGCRRGLGITSGRRGRVPATDPLRGMFTHRLHSAPGREEQGVPAGSVSAEVSEAGVHSTESKVTAATAAWKGAIGRFGNQNSACILQDMPNYEGTGDRTGPGSTSKSKLKSASTTKPQKENDATGNTGKKQRQQGKKRDPEATMSKLSPSLKALINAPFARPGQSPAPRHMRDVYARIAREATERRYGHRPWITLSAAATITLNSPSSLLILHSIASQSPSPTLTPLTTYELLREIALKCISFNGIPRTINTLAEFRAGLAHEPWFSSVCTTPTRQVTPSNADAITARARQLWTSIYTPFDEKLEVKLAESHPDLPVHILSSHYGPLLSDPEGDRGGLATVGRTLTSIVAIACLRAQTGVGPQVVSHVFGLRKGVEQGAHKEEFKEVVGKEGKEREVEEEAEGVERLATDEGSEWLLRSVDAIAEAIGTEGGGFGRWEEGGRGAKL
ncbi:hypothetical protein VTJ49DRAFT_1329 [Mycothermus thermophilus]|uniref:Dol-P-Man:Man(5)GlcNAc(2)-PP-Dol alpha-1,3-mannosyltransferase n=1 Tax=Humicola insolens TaxID=85995 RepID=A0ABR3VCW2_HUMIN